MVFAVDDLAVAPHEKEISGVVRAHLIRGPESVTAAVFKRLGVADGNVLAAVIGHLAGLGIVDGPVFLVARAVFDQVAVKYRDSWRALLQDRLDSVRLLEDKGVAVVGVVKRVERSRLLSVAAGIEALLSRCGLRVGAIGDRALIDAALRLGCFKWRPGSILRSPKLRVRLGEGLEKIVEYVVVPLGGFNLSPATARVYRLEYTQRTLSILKSRGLEPVHVFLADSVARDSLEPVTIASSDRRSSSITRALRRMLASTLRAWGVPISYSSMVEVAEDWREALAGS